MADVTVALLASVRGAREDMRAISGMVNDAVPEGERVAADGRTHSATLQGHVAYVVALTPRLVEGVLPERRGEAIAWLARYVGDYARGVRERALLAEREQGWT